MFTTEGGKQETFDTTKKIKSKAELHPAKHVVVERMRRYELETSASTCGAATITEKCKCRDLQHTKPSFPERNCENKSICYGRSFPLLFGLSMRLWNNWETKLEKLSHATFLSKTLYHIPFGIQVSWLKQKEERQPASGSFFNLGNISYSSPKYRFADFPDSYG